MKKASGVRRAAMGALVAMALVAGVEAASAGPYRAPADGPGRLPLGRAKRVDDGSGSLVEKMRIVLASWLRFPEGGGIRVGRFPASVRRDN